MPEREYMISIVVINYNMPEATDRHVEFIRSHTNIEHELIVVDNGSDLMPPSQYTNVWIPKNKDTLGGWYSGLNFSRGDAVWFLSTSTVFIDTNKDILFEMSSLLKGDTVCVCSNWQGARAVTHLQHGTFSDEPHPIKFIGPMAMWDRRWLKHNLPDPRLSTGWGTDFEMSYFLRQSNKNAVICPSVKMEVKEGIMYEMKRGHSTLDARRIYARKQMYDVLSEKYGENWKTILTEGTGIDPEKI